MTVVFDKLSFMRHLESEGTFSRPQAEKLSEAFHQAVLETVATKADIARLESSTKADIARLESRIDNMDARIDAKLAGVDAKLASMDAKLDTTVANMNATVANLKVWTVGMGMALFSGLTAIRFFGH